MVSRVGGFEKSGGRYRAASTAEMTLRFGSLERRVSGPSPRARAIEHTGVLGPWSHSGEGSITRDSARC
jgi:hypothetical protein